jgi:hypothetical protein
MFFFLTVIARFPKIFNLPKPVGDPDRPRLEALAVGLLAWLRLEIACLFAYILWSTLFVAAHRGAGLGEWLIALPCSTILLTVGLYLRRMISPPTQS